MKYYFLLISIISTLVSSASAQNVEEFWQLEDRYVSSLRESIKDLYNVKSDLVVIEYSIKRNPTKLEAEIDKYLYVKAINRAALSPISDSGMKEAMLEVGLEPLNIEVYSGVFSIPKKDSQPELISLRKNTRVLNNLWAKLLKP